MYNKRTGVTRMRVLVKLMCNLYTAYSAKIQNWVIENVTNADQRSAVLIWLAGMSAVCAILQATPDD